MDSAVAAQQQVRSEASPSFSWDALLKWSAFLITIGGLALHVAGSRYHDARIAAWGLDADLFPKPVEWVLMTGYYVAVGAISDCYLYLKTHWWGLAIWGLCIALLCYGGVMVLLHTKKDSLRDLIRPSLKRLPRWLLVLGFTTSYVSTVCLLILFAPLLLVAVLYLPSQLGKEAGDKVASAQITQFSRGCKNGGMTHRCMGFRREGMSELKGFLVESSERQLAIYLPEQRLVQVLSRDGIELVTAPDAGSTEDKGTTSNALP